MIAFLFLLLAALPGTFPQQHQASQ